MIINNQKILIKRLCRLLAAGLFCMPFSSLYGKPLNKELPISELVDHSFVNQSIRKSERDPRDYQAIKLNNQMLVLLVSDPQAVKSLGAIALPVGSLHDPQSQQGLAHYAEHMVLMGSERYPESDSFSQYLSQNAGAYNASTSANRTAFYFEVDNDAFLGALDRLADAIAAPLLDPINADKERNAVDAELTMARSNDGFRIAQVDSETINQSHPAAMFSGGNLVTLSDKPDSKLHDELIAFYQQYYSANLMVGVIYGQATLDELAQLAEETFGRIKDNHRSVEPILTTAVDVEHIGKMIYMEPAQPKKRLYIQFPIANNIDQFAKKSDEFIGYLLSNRSENTLFDVLQKQELIESISGSASPNRYGNSGIFAISVELTDKGLQQKDDVIAAVFNYINLLKEEGISSDYYHEIQQVLAIDFNYPDIRRNMSYVEWLANEMLFYPIEHVLDADYFANDFDPQDIITRLSGFTTDNARIWVIAPDQSTDKIAYFVNAPYRVENITPAQKKRWQQKQQTYQFTLPKLNPFIPNDFSIVDQSDTDMNSSVEFNATGNNIHLASQYFANEPKATLVLSLRSNTADINAKQQVLFQLANYLVNRSLAQLRFQASVAGVSLNASQENGLMISVNGFSQHLPDILLTIFNAYETFEFDEEGLALAKSWYLERLNAADNVNSYSLAMQPAQALSVYHYTEREERKAILPDISLADLVNYRAEQLATSVPYLLSMGNISKQKSEDIYKNVQSMLAPYHQDQMAEQNQFKPNTRPSIVDKLEASIVQQTKNTDAALAMIYIPSGYDEHTSRTYSYTLSKIVHPWFYTQLRSHEQLGYAVFAFSSRIGQSLGLAFLIQSNQYSPRYLYERYASFYPTALEKLSAMSDDEFRQYQRSVIAEMTQPPQTLYEELMPYLADFNLSQFTFDSKQKRLAVANGMTKKDLIDFYRYAVIDPTGLVLASQVVSDTQNMVEDRATISEQTTLFNNASELQTQIK